MATRLSASPRKNKSKPLSPSTPRSATPPAAVGHNSDHGEEAERVQLISIVSQLSSAEKEIEIAQGPLKAAQAKRSQIIGLGKAAGFTAKELTKRLDEMQMGTREMAAQEHRERKHRRWLGIIEPDQASLILGDSAPQEAKDEAHWQGEGFKAGLRQMMPKPPPECPERFVQPWMLEHERGLQQVLTANAPKAMGVRAQAAADFKADNPDAPEPGSPEAAAADRKAVRKAKEGLAALADRQPEPETESPTKSAFTPEQTDAADERLFHGDDAPAPSNVVAIRPADPDAGFEATAEELAAQAPRQAVQAVHAAEVDDEATAHPCPDCGAAAGVPCDPDCPSPSTDEPV